MRMTLQQIIEAVNSAIPALSPLDAIVTGISTDTRTLQPGDLFVALKGERFDGHNHVSQAFNMGAVAALVNTGCIDRLSPNSGILIESADTLVALGGIARAWRRRFSIPVVAVTGSVGKTTTKEMLAAALSPLGPVLKTEKNENNEVGVPQLLLRMSDPHKAVVVEMGMRGSGQIMYLAGIAEPTICVITVIGENHIELLGSIDNIAAAKGELIEALPVGGLAVLNADDPYSESMGRRTNKRTVTYGTVSAATMKVNPVAYSSAGWEADFIYQKQSSVEMATGCILSPAKHDIVNAAAAVLVACELGIGLSAAVQAVADFRTVGMRMEIVRSSTGATILSDCYNASPTSMQSAITTLAGYAGGRRVAFLGDMKELGDFAPGMHAQVAASAEQAGIREVYVVGEMFSEQFPKAKFRFLDSGKAAEFAAADLNLQPGDVVLIKGSRAMAMERILEALKPT